STFFGGLTTSARSPGPARCRRRVRELGLPGPWRITMSSVTPHGPDETVYPAKSQTPLFLSFIIGTVITGAVVVGLGLWTDIGDRLGVGQLSGAQLALLLGGVAVLVAVCGVYSWYTFLRWVALSRDGIRWWRGGRLHSRRWH